MKRNYCICLVCAGALLSACAGEGVSTIQGDSKDGRLTAYQVTAVPKSGQVQNTLLVWDNYLQNYEIKIGSESRKLSEALLLQVTGALPALISGAAAIQVAKDGACDSDTICGTVVYGSSAVAGATSGSKSGADAEVTVSSRNKTHGLTGEVFGSLHPRGMRIAIIY